MIRIALFAITLFSLIDATTITSRVSRGNWSSASTWSGGVVPSGTDDVVIRATDTVNVNIPVGLTGTGNNLCSLTVNGVLRLGSQLNMNNYSAFVANAGSSIELNGFDIYGRNGTSYRIFNLNGLNSSRIKVRSSISGGRIIYDDRNGNGSECNVHIRYSDFYGLGDINFLPWNRTCSLSVDRSAFTNCSRFSIGMWYSTVPVSITNSDFYNSKNSVSGTALDISSGENAIASNVQIKHCTFYHNSGAAIESGMRGTVVESCVFRNVNSSMLATDYTFRNNAMFQSNCYDNSKLFGDAFKGRIVGNFFWSDRDNPHWFLRASGTIDSNVIENTYNRGFGDPGDFIVSHENDTLRVLHNVFIDGANGSFLNQVSGSSGGFTYVYNNTYFADMSKPFSPPYYGAIRTESGGVFAGIVSVFNNIFCNRSGSPRNAAINLESAIADQIDSVDYNNFYNVAQKYYRVTITGRAEGQPNFGGFDKAVYPQFTDTSRCFNSWQSSIGSTDGIQTLLKINGYNPANATQDSATNYLPSAILNHIKDGFTPGNLALDNTGKNNSDIGAISIINSEPDTGLRMISGHPRLFMRPEQVAGFRTACKSGYNKDNYDSLKMYVDACLANGWGNGWGLMNMMCVTVVALVENNPTYLNAAQTQAQSFLNTLNPNNLGQFVGLTLSALAMYYDLLWDNNLVLRQAIADKLYACYAVEGDGSGDSHYGNHYLDAIERSTWFAFACKGDGYYDSSAERAYQTFLNRWYKDGDMKSIVKQISGKNGCIYESSYYHSQNWLPVLSVMLAAFETSHNNLDSNFVKDNFAIVYNASKIISHAKRPWDRMLDQTGDTYATWHIIGWVGEAIAQKWGGQIGHYLMTKLGNSYESDAQLGNPSINSWRNGPRGLLVLYHQNVSNPSFDSIPLSYKGTGEGGITSYMRSEWDNQNATWATFQAQDDMGGHMGAIQGHFQIGKYAPLATKSGSYCVFEDTHHYQYSFRTYAHNCATVYRSDEVFQNSFPLQNDGGQNFSGTFWGTLYTPDLPDLSNDIRYKEGADYTYSAADITNAYSLNVQKKISRYKRSFIYFRPDYFLVIDKIDALNGNYEKKWLLHTPNQPSISGLRATADNGNGRLFYKTLLPANATMSTVGGSAGYYYNVYNNTNYPPNCNRYESLTWRTEVTAPLGNTNDIFLNALQASSTSQGAMVAVDTLVSVSTGFKGAHFKTSSNPRIAVFSATNNRRSRVSFTPNQSGWSGTAGMLVTDLDTGTYKIYKNNVLLTNYSSVNVDSSGVLYFSDNSFGKYDIMLTSDVPPKPEITRLSQEITFHCSASDADSYQWQLNGVNISGAVDSTYKVIVSNVTPLQNNYRCIVGNANGTTISSEFQLIISSTGGNIINRLSPSE